MQKKSTLFENILSLGLIQGAEYLIPLLAIPYLLGVVGAIQDGEAGRFGVNPEFPL